MAVNIWKSILRKLFWGGFRHFLSDRQYAKIRYWLELDRPLNLKNPERFTEKIQYIKLFEQTELRRKVADRTRVRDYVAQKAGEQYLIPLVDVFDELTPEIWKNLPNQFVLKANHGCGMLKIVRDKKTNDFENIHRLTETWKNTDYYKFGREWAYKDIPRTLVAEDLILNSDGSIPRDYKFFCFHGRVEIIQVDVNRFGDQKQALLNREFKPLEAERRFPKYEGTLKKPLLLNEAIRVAELLSADFNFIRVDLYLVKNRIYFGELTNYPGNGFISFKPEKMEYELGDLLKLK